LAVGFQIGDGLRRAGGHDSTYLGVKPKGVVKTARPSRPGLRCRIRHLAALWITSLVSNIGTWMQNVGAAWAMTSLSSSPLMVALPVFVVGLPAGAVAESSIAGD
jgi:hypothetical protein